MRAWIRGIFALVLFWPGMAIVGVGSAVAAEAATSNVEGVSLEELQRIIQQQQQVIEAQQKRLEALEKKFEEAHPQPQKPAPMDTTHVHKEVVRSGFNLKFYGFLRGDLEGDTRRMNFDTQLPFYVLSPADPSQVRKRTGDVTFHPRLTRFGFDLNPPKFANGWTATAKLETDFFNAFIDRPARPIPDVAAAPNNPFLARDLVSNSRAALRVRHAYVRLQKEDVHILMGQTWDVISPLYPSLNADTVMWNAGNTADRRPQLRIGYEPAIGQGKWSLVGMVGSSGAVDNQDLDGDGFRDGEAAVSPTVQGRVGYSGPSHVSGQTWSAGVYGHLAHQNVNRFFFAGKSNFGSHLLGVDLSVPLTSWVRVQGEGWTGQNLSDVRGGIGQGIDLPTGREVRANGGWLETSFRVNKYYLFNLGATLDRPNAHDLTPAGARILNRAYYITNRFSLGKGLSLGFDYANWQTRYKALPTGTNNRFTFYIQNDF